MRQGKKITAYQRRIPLTSDCVKFFFTYMMRTTYYLYIYICIYIYILQHTATHCNTLQHTATHCNTAFFLPYTQSRILGVCGVKRNDSSAQVLCSTYFVMCYVAHLSGCRVCVVSHIFCDVLHELCRTSFWVSRMCCVTYILWCIPCVMSHIDIKTGVM